MCVFLSAERWTVGPCRVLRCLTVSLQWFQRASAVRAVSSTPAWPTRSETIWPRPAWTSMESLASAAPLGPNTAQNVPCASARYLTLTKPSTASITIHQNITLYLFFPTYVLLLNIITLVWMFTQSFNRSELNSSLQKSSGSNCIISA